MRRETTRNNIQIEEKDFEDKFEKMRLRRELLHMNLQAGTPQSLDLALKTLDYYWAKLDEIKDS